MWVRPTTHIYNYNTDISSFQSSALASAASSSSAMAASSSSASSRSMRASSEVAVDRSSTAQQARATSLAPEAGKSLAGYTGYYGRQLAMMREAEEARRLEAKSAQAASMKASSSAAASKSVAASMKSTTVAKTTVEETTSVQSAKKVSFESQQKQSLLEGRQSTSRAVRRAEHHAETSGKDPRHIGVPRDISDDICKKVADIHMAPFEGREIAAARAALSQGKLKIDRMEKELESITASAMRYQSIYSKSAAQMAKEAMMAAESEAKSSKTVRKTVVESSSRGQVAAA